MLCDIWIAPEKNAQGYRFHTLRTALCQHLRYLFNWIALHTQPLSCGGGVSCS